MKVLIIKLNNSGLMQSPCRTPLPKWINSVVYADVDTHVKKLVYRCLIYTNNNNNNNKANPDLDFEINIVEIFWKLNDICYFEVEHSKFCNPNIQSSKFLESVATIYSITVACYQTNNKEIQS